MWSTINDAINPFMAIYCQHIWAIRKMDHFELPVRGEKASYPTPIIIQSLLDVITDGQ